MRCSIHLDVQPILLTIRCKQDKRLSSGLNEPELASTWDHHQVMLVSVGLILSLTTGLTSPQLNVKYDNTFETLWNDPVTRTTPSLWQMKCGFITATAQSKPSTATTTPQLNQSMHWYSWWREVTGQREVVQIPMNHHHLSQLRIAMQPLKGDGHLHLQQQLVKVQLQ